MENMKKNKLFNLIMYNGSTDERNQRLYDRAGYYSFIFLIVGFIAEMFVKLFILRLGADQIIPELTILVLGGIFLTTLCVKFGVSIFENKKQKKSFRIFYAIVGIVLVSATGYIPLLLKLPSAQRILNLGPIAWFMPIFFSTIAVFVIWFLIKLVDTMGKRKSKSLEGDE